MSCMSKCVQSHCWHLANCLVNFHLSFWWFSILQCKLRCCVQLFDPGSSGGHVRFPREPELYPAYHRPPFFLYYKEAIFLIGVYCTLRMLSLKPPVLWERKMFSLFWKLKNIMIIVHLPRSRKDILSLFIIDET